MVTQEDQDCIDYIDKHRVDTTGLGLSMQEFEEFDFMIIGFTEKGWLAIDHQHQRFGYFESKEASFKFMTSYYLYELLQAQKRLEKTMNFTLSNNWK